MKTVVVTGSFDDIQSPHIRFLEEASKRGDLHVLLWSDETVYKESGSLPKFPQEERLYILRAVRYVQQVHLVDGFTNLEVLPAVFGLLPEIWIVNHEDDTPEKRIFSSSHGITYQVIEPVELKGFPILPVAGDVSGAANKKKILVTGSFDWLHSGHIRFFEETSEIGDLYVVVGHDENIRLLKGDSHPLFSAEERRYMVQSIRYVKLALLSTGHGWMDGEPEIELLKPDVYVVNEDGDVPEKRAFCAQHSIEYVVLQRIPKKGLPQRESTVLRGF
jgi:cytidyltransferase-like protein